MTELFGNLQLPLKCNFMMTANQNQNWHVQFCRNVDHKDMYKANLRHSSCRLSYDRSITPSKASSPQCGIWRFLFQFTVSSLFLNPVASYVIFLFFPSRISFTRIYPSVMCPRRMFIRKMKPSFCLVYVGYSPPP